MKPYYNHGGIKIFHGDCREVLPTLDKVDLLLTDPPYGMNYNTNSERFSGGTMQSIAKRGSGKRLHPVIGDDKQFDPTPLLDFPKVIIWGFHHFSDRLPTGTILVWIKRFDDAFGSFLSDADTAWMKGGCGVYCKRDTSNKGNTRNRQHPTIKPLPLIEWCITKAKSDGLICDPYCGSGTTLVAAKNLGRKAIGIELEEKYCEIAAKRLSQEVLPL